MFDLSAPTPLQQVAHPLLSTHGITLFLKRDDVIDKEISGNKWRKLKFNLLAARLAKTSVILTFGGAYSNHIAATASACKKYGFQSIGIIRGNELNHNANPTLQKAHIDGMKLLFVSRKNYKSRQDATYIQSLAEEYKAYVIPEGGSNLLGVRGIAEMLQEINIDFDYFICPVGTGGTLAGSIIGLSWHQKAIGITVLKGEKYLKQMITHLLPDTYMASWDLVHDYHLGGYAKYEPYMIDFILSFHQATGILLDPIYTGKMMIGIFDMIEKKRFAKGSTIVALHTGGLQSIVGFNKKHKTSLPEF